MTFAFVQGNFNYLNGVSTEDVVLNGVGAGNLIVAYVKHESTDTTFAFSDGTSSFTLGTEVNSASPMAGIFAWLLSANSGNRTYTLTLGASCAHVNFVVTEYSYDHANGTCEFDAQATGQGSGTSAVSGAITTSGTNCIALGGVSKFSAGVVSNFNIGGVAGGNMVPIASSAFQDAQAQIWSRVTTLSSGTASITVPSDDWICNIVAFKEAGVTVPPVTDGPKLNVVTTPLIWR